MIPLQLDTNQIHDVISWNDATVNGILIAIVLASCSVIYFLFKVNQELYKTSSADRERLYQEFTNERDRLYKDHLTEIKSFNELLIKINNQYYDSIRSLVELQKK
jgi:hypothetical protein